MLNFRISFILTFGLIFFLGLFVVGYANAGDRFQLLQGQGIKLCEDVLEILHQPENKNFYIEKNKRNKGTLFTIPERYKDYSRPKWEDVPYEDIARHIKSDKRLEDIRKHNKKVQKTKIDFDNYHPNGTEHTIVRYKIDKGVGRWACRVAFGSYQSTPILFRLNNTINSVDCGLIHAEYNNNIYLSTFRYDDPSNLLIMQPRVRLVADIPDDGHEELIFPTVCEIANK